VTAITEAHVVGEEESSARKESADAFELVGKELPSQSHERGASTVERDEVFRSRNAAPFYVRAQGHDGRIEDEPGLADRGRRTRVRARGGGTSDSIEKDSNGLPAK
jgi:hypothetical protein